MKTETNIKENRIVYFDVLRIIAVFFVIVLHVSEKNWLNTDIYSHEWQMMNLFDSVSRWCVPVLVMISGALFLSRDIPTGQLYGKYILRLLIAFVFWSAVYSLMFGIAEKKDFSTLIISFLKGHYHLWFIYMIIGLYMITPFLKKIIEDQKLIRYFVVLAVLFAILIPQTVSLITSLTGYGQWMEDLISQMHLQFVLGFTVYYVIGYHLSRISLSKKATIVICALGLLGFVSTFVCSSVVSRSLKVPVGWFYGYHTANVFLESTAVFVLVKNLIGKRKYSENAKKTIYKLSKISFGAYLIHALIIVLLDRFISLNSLTFTPFLSIPGISIIVFVVSFGMSAVLNRIPGINKCIV